MAAHPSRSATALPAPLAAMLRPDFYPARPADVEHVQTHISHVFLAGADVYKVKKPVRFAFLDFSTLALRRRFCHEEVRLNRRLAPDVYRGVVAICRREGGYALGPEDDRAVVEYAVHMRRLPSDRTLECLLDRGEATPAIMEAVAARLVEFHRQADAGPEIRECGDPERIWQQMDADFREVAAFHGRTISAGDDAAIQTFCRDFLRDHDALFRRRQAEGRIRDCHGDLHAEHVYVTNGLLIVDCIEFNPHFRHRDVAAEIAFLAMDLDYHGHPALAAHFADRYAALARDPDLLRLLPFYECHRAYIRGKVDSLKSAEPEVEPAERDAARRSAERHFTLAYRYTWAYAPCLVVVVGLSGTGKSTIARALHERTGFMHVNSDTIRKQLAGVPLTQRPAAHGADLYTPAMSARTYAAMFAAAGVALAGGRGVIVDATFQRRIDRDQARRVARDAGIPVRFVECQCPDEEVRRRLDERARRGHDASDADWAVYRQQRERYEPFAPDEAGDRLAVDTRTAVAEVVARIEAALRTASSPPAP